jgi:hypothetical protein
VIKAFFLAFKANLHMLNLSKTRRVERNFMFAIEPLQFVRNSERKTARLEQGAPLLIVGVKPKLIRRASFEAEDVFFEHSRAVGAKHQLAIGDTAISI